jgi:3-oxoacyl-[acyl-carrier-protein] synthase II
MSVRVVITGLGLITPLGIGVEPTWQGIIAGKSGIGQITSFDTTGFETTIAGEIKDFKPEAYMAAKLVKRMDRFVQVAVATAVLAMQDAQLEITPDLQPLVGSVVSCGLGGLATIEKYHKIMLEKGPKRISPFFIPMLIPNMAPGMVAMHFGAQGPNTSTVTACASGAHAVGDAFKTIQRGAAKAMITGGVESVITPLGVAGFNSLKALSTRNAEPEKASRPFDLHRDGFVMAEGGGILVMEELQFAKARRAKIYAEVAGYGLSGDAYHMTAPSPDGTGAILCMQHALADAGLHPDDVDHINSHGTSTTLNDAAETMAIKKVFGARPYKIPVSATKSMTGHILGGAGAVEAVISILSLINNIAPPTINYETPDPDCDLDYVPNQARQTPIDVVMSNAFGFGGTNAVLVLKKFTG